MYLTGQLGQKTTRLGVIMPARHVPLPVLPRGTALRRAPGYRGASFYSRRQRFSLLGELTDQQVLDQGGATAMLRGGSGSIRRQTYAQLAQAVASASTADPHLVGFNPAGCRLPGRTGLVLTKTGGQAALKYAGATGPLAPFVFAVGGVLEIFSFFFSHHAKAVAKERAIVCASVPAANDALLAIDGGVRSGQLSPQDGIAALNQLMGSFNQTVAPIKKSDSSHCNAACGWSWQLSLISGKLQSRYRDLAAGQSVPGYVASASAQAAAAAAGAHGAPLSSLAALAIGGIVLYLLV